MSDDSILEEAKRRRTKTPEKPKAVYISPSLHSWLATYCAKHGVFTIDVMNSLVARYKEQVEKKKK